MKRRKSHKSSRFHGLLVISSGYKVISISCEGGAAVNLKTFQSFDRSLGRSSNRYLSLPGIHPSLVLSLLMDKKYETLEIFAGRFLISK